jgi:hypothetical protein
MARWGVSVFLGSRDVPGRLPGYLDTVARLGGCDLFTSLHIPEVPLQDAVDQLADLTRAARARNLSVVADIAPRTLAALGVTPQDLAPLARMGLAGVRLDYGFSPAEIAAFARNDLGIRVVLNVSTADPDFLMQVMAQGANPELLEGCHNYYPRPETGLSLDSYIRTSRYFKQHGLRVAGFVPGTGGRRGPLFEGLPTVERHRHLTPGRAAAELLATGVTDTVLLGDPWGTDAELEGLATVARAEGVVLRVRLTPGLSEFERQLVVSGGHRNRPDAAELVIRSTASRAYAAQGAAIEPFHTVGRPRGSVTIDNKGYLRYSGELQITLADLPADPRVNVVGEVVPEDLPLLQWIGPGTPFTLIPVN